MENIAAAKPLTTHSNLPGKPMKVRKVPMIQSQVWGRIVRFAGERDRPGTGFLIDYNDCEYLITAKHLCLDEREEQLTIRHPFANDAQPVSAVFERCGDLDHPADVAAFRMPTPLAERDLILPVGSDGMMFSQDVYILGYPYGLFFQVGATGDPQQLPLVKKGILSGQTTNAEGVLLRFVDVFANPGFSGGPLIFHNHETMRLQVAGVIKMTILGPATDPAITESEPAKVPAGISLVTDIKHAVALLQ